MYWDVHPGIIVHRSSHFYPTHSCALADTMGEG